MAEYKSNDKFFNLMQRNLKNSEIKEKIKEKEWHTIKDIISELEAIDIAELFKEIDFKDVLVIFRLLPPDKQSEIFAKLDSETQEKFLRNLTDQHIKEVISEINPDDRTELFEEMPPDLTRKFLNLLSPEIRKEALQLLAYPENSVGRLLTPDYVAVRASWTIEEAIQHIRKYGKDAETIDVVYVIDDNWKLIDEIPIRRLILADSSQKVESVMDYHFISINVYADQEEAIKIMQKYDLISLPVVDNSGQLLGIVTIDDIMDVLQEEQTEDFTKISAIETHSIDLDLITKIREIPLKKLYRSRITWLIVLLFMDLVTGGIIQGFEQTIARYVVLVTFLPVLVDTAGNAGSQSATLVIRALALETVKPKDWIALFFRELVVAGAIGITMGFGISIMGVVRGGNFKIASVVIISMIINVIVGCLIGILLPFIFVKFKKDPATASTPLITTLADIVGTAIYLSIAFLILH